MSTIILKGILVIHLLLKVKPFACGLNCLPSFLSTFEEFFKMKLFIYFSQRCNEFYNFLRSSEVSI